jgi:hypothetical protein
VSLSPEFRDEIPKREKREMKEKENQERYEKENQERYEIKIFLNKHASNPEIKRESEKRRNGTKDTEMMGRVTKER